jgi:hypothetical protein
VGRLHKAPSADLVATTTAFGSVLGPGPRGAQGPAPAEWEGDRRPAPAVRARVSWLGCLRDLPQRVLEPPGAPRGPVRRTPDRPQGAWRPDSRSSGRWDRLADSSRSGGGRGGGGSPPRAARRPPRETGHENGDGLPALAAARARPCVTPYGGTHGEPDGEVASGRCGLAARCRTDLHAAGTEI